ncbi:MAG: phosphoribosylglycinamide formyltransferase [Pseudomonadota bacterium]
MIDIVVVLSGAGSNFQAIADEAASGRLPVRIAAVVSDQPDAYGLERARRAGIDAVCVPLADYATREAFDSALKDAIDRFEPKLVVLAGFMRRLGARFVRHYWGRLINVHPSLLPAYRGLHTYRRALAAGEAEHGTTVHFVTEDLDGGPLIAQAAVAIRPDDDEQSLSARVQAREYTLYPEVIRWFAEGRLVLKDNAAQLDGAPLAAPVQPLAATP